MTGVLRFCVTRGRIISLSSDFGLSDAYVAIMKAVMLDIASDATFVDLSHQIPPQDISSAAFVLASAYRYFPRDAVHLAVVDPGVGTSRRPIAIRTGHGTFVGPDNGIFDDVLEDQAAIGPGGELSQGTEAVELCNDAYRRHPVSATFHGRDIFAPAAAHLANGVALAAMGPPIDCLYRPATLVPVIQDAAVEGVVRYIDRFGNAISNIRRDLVPANARVEVEGRAVGALSNSYQDGEVVAIVGSTGYVEVAVRNGSAARRLHLQVGDSIVVRSSR